MTRKGYVEERKCPRCNGTGIILWPDPECNIERDTVMDMLHKVVYKMYQDSIRLGLYDGTNPWQHMMPLSLWKLAVERIEKGINI